MKYKIKYQEKSKVKTLILDEKQYKTQKLPKNIIAVKKSFDLQNFIKKRKPISNRVLLALLYELNLMLEAKILLDNAIDILINTNKQTIIKSFLYQLKHSYTNHVDIQKSLKEFSLDPFVVSSFKIIQNSGNPKEHIKTLYEILNEEQKIKEKMKRAFSYPIILLSSFFFALIGIFNFVIPKFQSMFTQNSFETNLATKTLFAVKDIYENHMLSIVFIMLIFIVSLGFAYYKNSNFEKLIDKILFEKLFIISKIYKYKLLYRFFYVINSLLIGKYEFDETIKKSKTLINNKYFLDRITRIDSSLRSGKSVYESFKQAKIFDELVLNIIKVAELSNVIEDSSYEIRTIYKKRFDEKVRILTILIEPIFFILIMLLIIWIIVAIFVPLWGIGDILKN